MTTDQATQIIRMLNDATTMLAVIMTMLAAIAAILATRR